MRVKRFDDLTAAARSGELVVVVGTGVSLGLTSGKLPALSWKGLIRHGLAHCEKRGKITPGQTAVFTEHLNSPDLEELLIAAEFVGRKLEAPQGDLYARWLDEVFKPARPTKGKLATALRALRDARVPICTLNYDSLLEQVTGLPPIHLGDPTQVAQWLRRERPGILHLHGTFESPKTCILGIRDYETTLGNEVRDLFQRTLSAFRHLLFLGCGATFEDPNFSALIRWLRTQLGSAAPLHHALVCDGEVAARHADPAWHGFVEPVGYGADHTQLADFLLQLFPPATAAKKPARPKVSTTSTAHAQLIQDYRAFLIKDCGQMTIEGLRADLNTAQRRFDLERLFVPLRVLVIPPQRSESDPKDEQSLVEEHLQNLATWPFGEAFAEHPRLALLALPGGGKTVLLKRLAVAYADPARRGICADGLPDLDLLPVLIRCREWRDHIHLPIATLLGRLPDITGQPKLAGLGDALLPLFKKGGILLLVDGLDEIHDDGRRNTFVKNLESFLEDHPETRLVITSREAGFDLVAPCIARFCARWRVAPLSEQAITTLCEHWHRLMKGDSEAVLYESHVLARQIQSKQSLLRLAVNPLLLTMLLVVKHGAGRLPADRATLYERAVEVLLDTWNIEGHERLQLKEAVPQLAYVAFQMMRASKQTATQSELLALLQEARERMPQIGRYAQDAPHAFLKRVELRSSLLVEAGHQIEDGRAVPFYQFRHLTFQEYLAAVAAREGHYAEYKSGDTVLTPLAPYLFADEWKEVIPMAAALAGKQAEPLMAALTDECTQLRSALEANRGSDALTNWLSDGVLPTPVMRLLQCLAEEADAAPDTLTSALQVVAVFASRLRHRDLVDMICWGPYGAELAHQTWLLYAPMSWSPELQLDDGYVDFLRQWGLASRQTPDEFIARLDSQDGEELASGLAILATSWGRAWTKLTTTQTMRWYRLVEQHLFQDDPALSLLALRAYRSCLTLSAPPAPTPKILDRLLWLLLNGSHFKQQDHAAQAFSVMTLPRREEWKPSLTPAQVQQLVKRVRTLGYTFVGASEVLGLCRVAFHNRSFWPDEQLAARIDQAWRQLARYGNTLYDAPVASILSELGEAGQKYLAEHKQKRMAKRMAQGASVVVVHESGEG